MRRIWPAVIGAAALLSGGAMAQKSAVYTDGFRRDLMIHCGKLVWQFEQAAGGRYLVGNAETARKDRQAGERLCRNGRYFEGIAALEKALRAVHVRPVPAPQPGEPATAAATFR